jgi:hypothetical protein
MVTLPWRSLVSISGILAIAWAAQVFPFYRETSELTDTAQRILLGDQFSAAQLDAMKQMTELPPSRLQEASTSGSAAIIRLFLFEQQLKTGGSKDSASSIAELKSIVNTALVQSPTNSFLWATDVWIKRQRGEFTESDFNLLRMSYETGANEAWIAIRRNPLTLSFLPSLPNDIKERAVAEFARMVDSGFFEDASNVLAGPGWPIREQLVNGLGRVSEFNRRVLAGVLADKNIEGVTVPGVSRQSSRPF